MQLSLALLIAVAACSPAATPAPPTPAPPTQGAPTETPTPLIAATVEVTAEATTATEAATAEMTIAATDDSTAAATEAGLISTREATAESTSSAQMFMIRQTGNPAACAITPTSGEGVNIRQAPTKDSALLGGLLRGAWVVASGVNQTGTWFQISAPGTPADGGWITRQNVALRRGCSCVVGGLCHPDAVTPSATAEATQ
jgi:hypothetical protein